MEQTPIEKAIAELIEKKKTLNTLTSIAWIHDCVEHLESLIPYEKTYHRNIAEKAWDDAILFRDSLDYDGNDHNIPDKQTYLTQFL